MTQKRRQHIIPQVYLRAFCDPLPPINHPTHRPFTPSLWIHHPSLTSEPTRSAPKNIMWGTRTYNLVQDDVDQPWLEESLSRLETFYSAIMRRVGAGSLLSTEDTAMLSLFIGALQARTTTMMGERQAFFDRVTGFSRAYMGDKADKSIEPWGELADAGKRQISISAEAFANVAGPHMMLLENRTPMPFITSDEPVTLQHLHVDELLNLGVPEYWLFRDIPRSARELFVTCPLAPHLMYVASRFFPPRLEAIWHSTMDLRLVLGLNEITRINANKAVFASTSVPYGELLPIAIEQDRRRTNATALTGLRIYTETDRHWLSTTSIIRGQGEHALTGRITFETEDLLALHTASSAIKLVNVEVYDQGHLMGWLREAWFTRVALASNTESVIENGPIDTPWD